MANSRTARAACTIGIDRESRLNPGFAGIWLFYRDPGYCRDRLNLPGSSREFKNLYIVELRMN